MDIITHTATGAARTDAPITDAPITDAPITDTPGTDARVLAQQLEAAGLDPRDLDEWVLEHGQHEASRVNSGGLVRQVAYLLEHGETPQKILDAFGLNGSHRGELERALRQCWQVLGELSQHPVFANGAPHFREGGVGHEARRQAGEVLQRAHGHGRQGPS